MQLDRDKISYMTSWKLPSPMELSGLKISTVATKSNSLEKTPGYDLDRFQEPIISERSQMGPVATVGRWARHHMRMICRWNLWVSHGL